jgi:ferrous iron transport protein B
LPSYKWPGAGNVLVRMLERAWSFVYRAGTLILAVAIVVWFASYYPHDSATVESPFQARRAEADSRLAATAMDDKAGRAAIQDELTDIDNDVAAAYQRQSVLGRLGRVIEPAVRPLGWDWRIGSAVMASFPAREVVVGVLGVIYNLGTKLDPGEEADQGRLVARIRAATWDGTDVPVYNVPVALSIMVFFALCAQCSSTLVIIRRETNSWSWPAFTFIYMTSLAYIGALITYQLGRLIVGV